MLEEFKNNILKDFPDFKDRANYVACSGGVDSMVLTHLLIQIGAKPTLLHCNFNLRGDESDADEALVTSFAKSKGLKCFTTSFNTKSYADEYKLSIQEAARVLRYNWFASKINADSDLVLTAHHLNDNIETLFINLSRGTGLKGVSGIPRVRLPFYRPLLNFSKSQILEYQKVHEVPFRNDSSNQELKYLRNKIRHQIIPPFLESSEQVEVKMNDFFGEMNEVRDFLEKSVDEIKRKLLKSSAGHQSVDLNDLNVLERVQKMYLLADFGIQRKQQQAFDHFLSAQTGATFQSDEYEFLINRDELVIRKLKDKRVVEAVCEIVTELPFEIKTSAFSLKLDQSTDMTIAEDASIQKVDFDKVDLPLQIRTWSAGDRINPLGMKGTKLVSDVLTDKQLSLFEKEEVLVIEDAKGELIAIPGLVIADAVKLTARTKRALRIVLVE